MASGHIDQKMASGQIFSDLLFFAYFIFAVYSLFQFGMSEFTSRIPWEAYYYYYYYYCHYYYYYYYYRVILLLLLLPLILLLLLL